MNKKALIISITILMFSLIIQSCGSSKSNCDAYGQNSEVQNTDLAKK